MSRGREGGSASPQQPPLNGNSVGPRQISKPSSLFLSHFCEHVVIALCFRARRLTETPREREGQLREILFESRQTRVMQPFLFAWHRRHLTPLKPHDGVRSVIVLQGTKSLLFGVVRTPSPGLT